MLVSDAGRIRTDYDGTDSKGRSASPQHIHLALRPRTPVAESAFDDPSYGYNFNGGSLDRVSEWQLFKDVDYDFSCGPLSRFNSQRPALDVFIERFVDVFSPQVDVNDGRAGAIRAAANIRMFSPQISDAFEAVSVTFFGRSIQDKRIEASGFRLYPKVLRSLQAALRDPQRSRAESTLLIVTLLMAFEVSGDRYLR